MKTTLNTNLVPLFSGTYESIWEVYETDDQGNELPVDYNQADFMASIASEYQKHNAYIKSELAIDFIKSINFTGGTNSPREYNFSTDTLDFEVEINKTKLLQTLKNLETDQEFSKYLKDNFTSYDGFMSFTPNNYHDLKTQIVGEGDEYSQALGALITYLGKNIEHGGGTSIEEMVFDSWQGNGYGGLDYKIEEEEK